MSGTKKNALIYCSTKDTVSTCSVLDAHNGYYHPNGEEATDQLIKCDASGCTKETIATEGYYINASSLDKSKIILCAEDSGIKCNSIDHKATTDSPFHIIDDETSSKRVITCLASEGCYMEEKVKGYFLNSDTTSGAKKLITCDGSDCTTTAADPTDYAGVGTLKVTNTGVTMCIAVGCSGKGEMKIEASSAAPVYKTITLAADDDFPGNSGGDTTISVRIGNDGSVLLLEDTGLTETCATDIYCLDSSKIKYNDDAYMTEAAEGTYVYYFNTENERIDPPTLPGNIPDIMAYECSYDGTPEMESCTLVKGYVVDSRNAITIHCSGWKHEGCRVISTTACVSGDEGKLTSGRRICYNTSKISLPTIDDEEKSVDLALITSDINSYYGVAASEVLYLTLKYVSPSYSSVTVSIPAGKFY